MIIPGSVSITMAGGMVPFGNSNSALLLISPAILVSADPNRFAAGQQYIGGRLNIEPQANVVHQGEVDINSATNP